MQTTNYHPSRTLDLPHVKSISPESLEADFIARGIPVVITGMSGDWPAGRKWNLSFLREVAGDVKVPVRGNRHHFRLLGTTSFADYVAWLQGDSASLPLGSIGHMAPYISHNRGLSPFLEADVDFTRFAPPGYRLGRPAFWLGPPGAETPLHYDSVGIVFFAQMIGRKEAILFPKEQSRLLYESDYFDFTTCYSRVNLRDVDAERFPRFAEASPYWTVLQPGEVLVFPRRLWHEFRALDVSLSVTMHAGTRHDYSHRNAMLLRERCRQVFHWLGCYARGKCSCHSTSEGVTWEACMGVVSNSMAVPDWARRSKPLYRYVLAISRGMLHDRALGSIVGWREPDEATAAEQSAALGNVVGAGGGRPHWSRSGSPARKA